MGVRFRACRSSHQGATATPTAVLLSSVRRPPAPQEGRGLAVERPRLGSFGCQRGLTGLAPAIRRSTEVARAIKSFDADQFRVSDCSRSHMFRESTRRAYLQGTIST